MSKTDIFCKALGCFGMLVGKAAVLRLGSSSKLRILAYHRVLDSMPDDFPYDRDVISCNSGEFRREMEFVARNFDVVTFKNIAENGVESYRRPLVITFDDGYKDNYDVVLPILKEMGIPAVFFVTTDYINGNEIPWWDEIYLYGGKEIYSLHKIKSASDKERLQMLEELRNTTSGYYQQNDRLMMNWDEVRKLADAGMEIGSHTVSHPILRNIRDIKKVKFEIVESKKIIEKNIGRNVISFSYPVGRMSSADNDIVEVVKNAGYEYAVIYEHGVNDKNGFDAFRMFRIKTEVGDDFNRFKAKVLFPGMVKY